MIENSSSTFEKFSLVSKTELLRRSLNFLSYLLIFLIGLEILISFSKTINVNRILIYGFGACLIYEFIESVFADSISVFMLPYYLQAFPILLICMYFGLRKRLFFNDFKFRILSGKHLLSLSNNIQSIPITFKASEQRIV